MTQYVGQVRIRSNNGYYYANFYPYYKLSQGRFISLEDSDLRKLLPGSQLLNIQLHASLPGYRIEEQFMDWDEAVLSFEKSDLEKNVNQYNEAYPSAWKLNVTPDGKEILKTLDAQGWIPVIAKGRYTGDWHENERIDLLEEELNEGRPVLLQEDDGTFAGPFETKWDDDQERFYILTKARNRKSVVPGIEVVEGRPDVTALLDLYSTKRQYINVKSEGTREIWFDLMDERQMADSLKNALIRTKNKGKLDLTRLEEALDIWEQSPFGAGGLPQSLAKERREKLNRFFDETQEHYILLQNLAKTALPLLENYASSQEKEAFVKALADDPDFMAQVQELAPMMEKRKLLDEEISVRQLKLGRLNERRDQLMAENYEGRALQAKEQLEEALKARDQASQELQTLLENSHIAESIDSLQEKKVWLEEEAARRSEQIELLEGQLSHLQKDLDDTLQNAARRAMEQSFDQMIASRLAVQGIALAREKEKERYQNKAAALKSLANSWLEKERLVDTLVHNYGLLRPDLSRNEILNLFITQASGPLCLFTGRPGSGKTSMCRTLARCMGLMLPSGKLTDDGIYSDRFVQIAVQRNWTSRRDWIGGWNPLTQTFDKASDSLFDLLSVLDREAADPAFDTHLPAWVLLDEATLSSMEYYFADFMTMDPMQDVVELNLGEHYLYKIPSRLHFMATVNSDHTTEPLSYRLLDRAWVIDLELGRLTGTQNVPSLLMEDVLISQDALNDVFVHMGSLSLPQEVEEQFGALMELLDEHDIYVSARSRKAMRRYILSAGRWMESSDSKSSWSEALDFALSQRALIQIHGNGESFGKTLEEIRSRFEEQGLTRCVRVLDRILENGRRGMQYYQYFA